MSIYLRYWFSGEILLDLGNKCIALELFFRLVAAKVHARFPNYQSLVKAKILLPHEARRLELVDDRTPHETTYIPILWALNLIQKARTDGQIKVHC